MHRQSAAAADAVCHVTAQGDRSRCNWSLDGHSAWLSVVSQSQRRSIFGQSRHRLRCNEAATRGECCRVSAPVIYTQGEVGDVAQW